MRYYEGVLAHVFTQVVLVESYHTPLPLPNFYVFCLHWFSLPLQPFLARLSSFSNLMCSHKHPISHLTVETSQVLLRTFLSTLGCHYRYFGVYRSLSVELPHLHGVILLEILWYLLMIQRLLNDRSPWLNMWSGIQLLFWYISHIVDRRDS